MRPHDRLPFALARTRALRAVRATRLALRLPRREPAF